MTGSDFFEMAYRNAERDAGSIPWASLAPNAIIERWLQSSTATPGEAVVVASGLGDDAEVLAAHGWHVTAFDIAPSAIEWAEERFPTSTVDYLVADLFELPLEWSQAFSLVLEVFTIQSISPAARVQAVHAIADLVAPGGTLLVAAIRNDGPRVESGPPWPLIREDFIAFNKAGLEEVAHVTRPSSWDGFDHLEVEYRRLPLWSKPDRSLAQPNSQGTRSVPDD